MPEERDAEQQKARSALLKKRTDARARVLARLEDEGAEKHARRLARCGEKIPLKCTNCTSARVAFARCDLKWCPSCAPRITHDKTDRYAGVVETMINPLFVTFSTRNFDARSKKTTGLRETRRAFTRLRGQRWWKRCCRGGVASFEMTRKKKGWHPHAHALLDSAWFAATVTRPPLGCSKEQFKHRAKLACEEIAAQWTMACGGRRGSIDVRKVSLRAGQTVGDALKEVFKYSVTSESLDNITGNLSLLLDELDLTRNLTSFGSCYRHPALKKKERSAVACECCGEFGTFLPKSICDAFEDSMMTPKQKAQKRAAELRRLK